MQYKQITKMRKFYCNLGHKWCKYCRNIKTTDNKEKTPICVYCKNNIACMHKCPRLAEIETVRFSEMARNVDFDKAFACIVAWYPNQANEYASYKKVYDTICKMNPNWHKLGDMLISVAKEDWDGKFYPNVSGVTTSKQNYGIEFVPWKNWISMWFTQDTLDTFTHEEIVGACLWEMTYNGFDEQTIDETRTSLEKEVECAMKTN